MAYEVLARKWRPQGFDDLIGQEHVSRTLINAIEAERIAHAYLFVGPRGIGKTSVARIFAKALNCESGVSSHPCNECQTCTEIIAGRNLDVIEIDGASNTGVDNVRELRENVMYAPARCPYKIYIIDEVHMLSTSASNALLKTLEEPPKHVKFIFATTEPQKMLSTILSRCQRFDLRRIPVQKIVERLKTIATVEGVTIDDDALLAMARGAEGGLRDALSAQDQLIAFCGKTIAEEDVLSVFGLISHAALAELAASLLRGDVPSIVGIVGRLDDQGKDLERVVSELLEHFRNLLVYFYMHDRVAEMDVAEAQIETLREHAALTDVDRVLRMTDILTETAARIRHTLSRRVLLETDMIRCARSASVATVDEVLEQLGAIQDRAAPAAAPVAPRPPAPSPAAGPPAAARPAAREPAAPSARPREPAAPAATEASDDDDDGGAGAAPADESPPTESGATGDDEVARLRTAWHEIIDRVGRAAPLARSCLLDGAPVRVAGKDVVVGIDPEFSEHLSTVEVPRNRAPVERVIGDVLGRRVAVAFELIDGVELPQLPADTRPTPKGPAAADGPTPGAEPSAAAADKDAAAPDVTDDPAVVAALEMFNGSIIDVRE